MLPFLREHFGNPSSAHAYGKVAHEAVNVARSQVAELLGARPDEIVFTGGGSEANNHAIKGAVFARPRTLLGLGPLNWWRTYAHIITSTVEHPATRQPCEFLRRVGCKVTQI